MIVFQDLRISSDGNQLFIDAVIAPYNYYEGMFISSISIDTEQTFIPSGPSGSVVYSKEFQDQNKEQSLILTPKDLNLGSFNNHILYVYVEVDGIPDSMTPCGMDNKITLGVALNWYTIYRQGLKYMRQTSDNCCGMSREFVDYILRFKAFELALRTANYQLANNRFLQWFSLGNISSYSVSPCNCN